MVKADPPRMRFMLRLEEVTPDACACGKAGHAFIASVIANLGNAYEGNIKANGPLRRRMHKSGMIDVVEAAEGGWDRGMWMATPSPAGLHHHAAVTGNPDSHIGGCGGTVDVNGVCGGCQMEVPLTTQAAARRIEAMPPGEDHDREEWASRFSCSAHGHARYAHVKTDKCCGVCGEGFIRHGRTALQDQ